jgi:glycosyltransferase involved in cell wall biosynthesis
VSVVNITYILSNINKALAFEWVAEELDVGQFSLSFILLNPAESDLERFLVHRGVRCYRIPYRGKQDLLKAIYRIAVLLRKERTDVVHCHLFDACIAGLTAARLIGVHKRIYTRHHSTLHHVYFPRAVWYDKFINLLATDIVAISRNVRDVLLTKEKATPGKVHLIHHGFRLDAFDQVETARIGLLKIKYGLTGKWPVVGVISRYVDWKGIQYIIPAFRQLLANFPDARLALANATGDFTDVIGEMLCELPTGSYMQIPFETDIYAFYHTFDIFIHVPVNEHIEAFGQTYIEALAAGIPSVFTSSGVAAEFIQHEKNALLVPFQDPEAIFEAINRLLTDEPLRKVLRANGARDVERMFALKGMIGQLENLYLS